ncbi:MAG: LamG-like jellyroll fold domain-containing protein [Planctomycetota bacterium]|jgi:hypothetical protein
MRCIMILVVVATMASAGSAQGRTSPALGFDGLDDWVDFGAGPKASAPFTLEAWVKPTRASTRTQLIAGPYGADRLGCFFGAGFFLRPGADNTTPGALAFVLGLAGCGNDDVIDGPVPTLGQWYHLAGTYDGSTMRFFVDGTLVGELENIDYTPFPRFVAGCGYNENAGGADVFFAGEIDDLRHWNVVRTGTEIAQTRSQALQGDEVGLAAYWNFDEGAGQVANEIVGGVDNGRLGDTSDADAADPVWIEASAPPSAEEALQRLLDAVDALDLPPHEAHHLATKLRIALRLLQDRNPRNDRVAAVLLGVFTRCVSGPHGWSIPDEAADDLIASARAIKKQIRSSTSTAEGETPVHRVKSRLERLLRRRGAKRGGD